MAVSTSHSLLKITSYLFGWIYTFCWSLSFYPQPIINIRRRSTRGTTIDFPFINVLGFVAYFVSNTAFLYSPLIRKEYALRNKGLTPTVQVNDLAFAAHAVVLSAIVLSQFVPSIWGFEKRGRGSGATPSRPIWGIFVGSFVGVAIVATIVAGRGDENPVTGWAWIDVVSLLNVWICDTLY
jgi:cystinosin